MSHYDAMTAELFRRRGLPAVYAAPGDPDVLTVQTIRQGGGDPVHLGPVKVIVDRTLLHVRRAELPAPVVGATLALGGDTFTVEAVQPCERDVDALKWQLECSWGVAVAYRSVSGSGATQNPPVATAPKVAANASAGAATITINSASMLVGKLVAGDAFTVAGKTYTVTADRTAASNALTNVAFTPALAANVSAGEPVTFTFVRDYPVRAAVSAYLQDEFAAGVQVGDRRLVILESALDEAGMTGQPKAGDKVTMGDQVLTVVKATAVYRGSTPVAWDVQARG